MAWLIPVISLRRDSDAISPAGSSDPRLMRKPLLNRSSLRERSCWLAPKRCIAWMELMFVLMRLMASSVTNPSDRPV